MRRALCQIREATMRAAMPTDLDAKGLLPCPHCGCTDISRVDNGDEEWFECDWCHATSGWDSAPEFEGKPLAWHWNRRAALPPCDGVGVKALARRAIDLWRTTADIDVICSVDVLEMNIEAAIRSAFTAVPVAGEAVVDIEAYYERQIEWSKRTFGPALRTKGILDHIRKELSEIEAEPHDLSEWVDVVTLAMDGFWRHGGTASGLMPALLAKQVKNFARQWPDWRTMSEDRAIEHDRGADASPVPASPRRDGYAGPAVNRLNAGETDPSFIKDFGKLSPLPTAVERGTLKMPTDPDWYQRKAVLEDEHEIGAGRRTATINLTDDDIAAYERLVFEALPKWAQDEITRLRAISSPALPIDGETEAAHRNFVDAWEALPGGEHRPSVVQDWLVEIMKPAVDRARSWLSSHSPNPTEAKEG